VARRRRADAVVAADERLEGWARQPLVVGEGEELAGRHVLAQRRARGVRRGSAHGERELEAARVGRGRGAGVGVDGHRERDDALPHAQPAERVRQDHGGLELPERHHALAGARELRAPAPRVGQRRDEVAERVAHGRGDEGRWVTHGDVDGDAVLPEEVDLGVAPGVPLPWPGQGEKDAGGHDALAAAADVGASVDVGDEGERVEDDQDVEAQRGAGAEHAQHPGVELREDVEPRAGLEAVGGDRQVALEADQRVVARGERDGQATQLGEAGGRLEPGVQASGGDCEHLGGAPPQARRQVAADGEHRHPRVVQGGVDGDLAAPEVDDPHHVNVQLHHRVFRLGERDRGASQQRDGDRGRHLDDHPQVHHHELRGPGDARHEPHHEAVHRHREDRLDVAQHLRDVGQRIGREED
jgi:hypothetical protein